MLTLMPVRAAMPEQTPATHAVSERRTRAAI